MQRVKPAARAGHCLKRNSIVLSLLFLAAAAGASPAPASPEVAAALERAGTNRPALETALERVAPEQLGGMQFLIANMPQGDLACLSADFLLHHVTNAYAAMAEVPWGKSIPEDIFLNEILPYSIVNERRETWRADFRTRFLPLVRDCATPSLAAARLNQKVFAEFGVHYSRARAKADQSPYESIEGKTASCTGLSILLIAACRSVGVPARFAGTPLWTDRSGNHSWVEIWDGGWHFTGAAEPAGDALDQAWFVRRASEARRDDPAHAIYASSYRRTPLHFPLVWAEGNTEVPAVNVTDRYIPRNPPAASNTVPVSLVVLAEPRGRRLAARLRVIDAQTRAVLFEGMTKNEGFDGNDHLEVFLTVNHEYRIEAQFMDRLMQAAIRPDPPADMVVLTLKDSTAIEPALVRLTDDEKAVRDSEEGQVLRRELAEYFSTPPADRARLRFSRASDRLLARRPATALKFAWAAYRGGWERSAFAEDAASNRVSWRKLNTPFTLRAVGAMPANGWPVVIALHEEQEGGTNDQQWAAMVRYYQDLPDLGGYLYIAPRTPARGGKGFAAGPGLHLTDRLLRQLGLFLNIDPDRAYIVGYGSGGYGALYQGMRLADRWAAVHAAAAAPGEADPILNLRHTPLMLMVGENDAEGGRLERCRALSEAARAARGGNAEEYPVRLDVIPGREQRELPDRDRIRDLYPNVRAAAPRDVTWVLDPEIDTFYWLHVPRPTTGATVTASCVNNTVTVQAENVDELHILLDERLIRYDRPVVVKFAGRRISRRLSPSMATLCETLAQRGDPRLAFSSRLVISPRPKAARAAAAVTPTAGGDRPPTPPAPGSASPRIPFPPDT